jgi:hypothetical protein
MGLGSAMAGGNPTAGREKRDFYPTPWEVTQALCEFEQFEGAIHECACGNGAMSRELNANGYQVISTDLEPQGWGRKADFLKIPALFAHNIVTNPPFDLAVAFIEHAMNLRPRKLALMLKSTFWHAKTRGKLYNRFKPARICPLTWRPDFMGLGRPTMEVMWCIWDAAHTGEPTYHRLDKPLARRALPAIA